MTPHISNLPVHHPIRLRAFTLVELLTLIAVIGILAAILIPALTGTRQNATTTASGSNLRQLGLAVLAHANENRGKLAATVPDGKPQWNYGGTGEIFQFVYNQDSSSGGWDAIENTVFESPASRAAYPEASMNRHSFAKNSHLGQNASTVGNLYDLKSQEVPLASIPNPAKAALLLDFRVSNFTVNQSSFDEKLQFGFDRHGGEFIQVVYADGHLGTVTKHEYEEMVDDEDAYLAFLTGR